MAGALKDILFLVKINGAAEVCAAPGKSPCLLAIVKEDIVRPKVIPIGRNDFMYFLYSGFPGYGKSQEANEGIESGQGGKEKEEFSLRW